MNTCLVCLENQTVYELMINLQCMKGCRFSFHAKCVGKVAFCPICRDRTSYKLEKLRKRAEEKNVNDVVYSLKPPPKPAGRGRLPT